MKKVTFSFLAGLLIAALVAGAMGVRYSRRVLGFRPPSTVALDYPTVAWLGMTNEDDKGPLMFDLHRVATYPAGIDFPLFSTTSGWSVRETSGTWAVGKEAIFDFQLNTIEDRTLVLNTNSTGGLFERPQYVTVTLNQSPLGKSKISDSKPLSTFRIPAKAQSRGLNRLVFKFDHTVKPSDRRAGNDTRPLAAWFRNITILNGSSGEIAASLRAIKLFRNLYRKRGSVPVSISHRQRLLVREQGSVISAVDTGDTTKLDLEIRPKGSATSLRITAHDLIGQTAQASLISPKNGGSPTDATLQLPDTFKTAFLEIEVLSADEDKPIRLTAPWLTSLQSPSRNSDELQEIRQKHPANIVVLILDAARADRFGCYGSDRPTTPHIDSLAAESIVFPDAVALAPYTLCSVPTMATGLSFLEHGVVERGQSLSASSTTLAEILEGAGYKTAAFSATPNNSKKLGVAQGYQVFEEAWRGVQRGPALDPHRLVKMAETWLADQPHDRPYHLMLHMVPPHEPYEPGPQFDKFSDSEYRGPADGSRQFIDLFNGGPQGLGNEDLVQTKALYDGNLLKADDAIGHLLDTLRKRPDWDRTAVVVTSDHGEALGEHGRIGHNAHVFEEMIRIPLILKLPDDQTLPGRNIKNQSASLADLAPTLAGLAGLRFPDSLTGQDLLSEAPITPRPMVIRTAHERPTYALRTPRWKLVVRNATEMDLYDLSADPFEKEDLAETHREVAAGLRQVLLTHLAAEPLFSAADEAGLTGQDEEMLRTLGYIE